MFITIRMGVMRSYVNVRYITYHIDDDRYRNSSVAIVTYELKSSVYVGLLVLGILNLVPTEMLSAAINNPPVL